MTASARLAVPLPGTPVPITFQDLTVLLHAPSRLVAAYDLKQQDQEVEILFQGAGTRWAPKLADPDHAVHDVYSAVADRVRGVSHACANVFGAADESRALGFQLIGEDLVPGTAGLPSLGFATSPDGRSVLVRRTSPETAMGAGAWPRLRPGSDVGLLAIDLATRRRFRVNGVLRASDASGFEVGVREAYPNCRKYIRLREGRPEGGGTSSSTPALPDGTTNRVR